MSSFAQAKILLETLARYDLFQLVNNIKPDYSNAGGLCIWEDGEWSDYDESGFRYDTTVEGAGEDFRDIPLTVCIELDKKWEGSPQYITGTAPQKNTTQTVNGE